jgi:nucleotide-binding universal stress UspA family protein
VILRPSSLPSQLDLRPTKEAIVVAVNGGPSGWRALDWAAAEAATGGAPLRIVHVVAPSLVMLDPLGGTGSACIDPTATRTGALVLDIAERRASRIAPVAITTHLECGRLASTLREAARGSALTVVGRSRPKPLGSRSVSCRILRRALAPVAIVQLDDERIGGPSAGRVVLGIDNTGGPTAAFTYALEAASRRGVGLTVVHAYQPSLTPPHRGVDACPPFDIMRRLAAIDDVVQIYRDTYPNVDVRRRFVPGAASIALAAESQAAALLVLGASTQRPLLHARAGSVARGALRWAQSPIAVIPALPESNHRRWRS